LSCGAAIFTMAASFFDFAAKNFSPFSAAMHSDSQQTN
jgi:hypothetical protein